MAIGDVYRLTLRSTQVNEPGNPYLNVFYYRIVTSPGSQVEVDGLLAAFDNSVLGDLGQVISDTVTFDLLDAVQATPLGPGSLFGQRVPSTTTIGQVSGAAMPQFVSWGFRYNRGTRLTRNGYKRFSIPGENDVDGDSPTASAQTALNTLAATLGGLIANIGNVVEAVPVIARTDNTGTVLQSNSVASVQFYGVTSQNSRKR